MPAQTDLANAIRILAVDAVQQANSGHPGAPMGMADIMTVLWRGWLRHNPANPAWQNRDRFVLSNGHGSMLLYATLHLSGYALSLDALRNFRQLHSGTPGHPEAKETPGVEVTTGPLGQGFACAVGMAIAEKVLAAHYNKPDFPVIDHRTWTFLGDGCLMEGISHEAASLAGVLQLGKLIAVYDDNNISIDGEVTPWFNDDTPGRFRAYGWHVIDSVDGHDPEAVNQALETATQESDRPSLICAKTIIGFGSPNKQGSASTHGGALGQEEVAAVRQTLNWQHEPFDIPEEIYANWDCKTKGTKQEANWNALWDAYQKAYPECSEALADAWSGKLPQGFAARHTELIDELLADSPTIATREASRRCLEAVAPVLPDLLGGSADLTASCCTKWSGSIVVNARTAAGNYLHYGVREFAMTAIANGIGLHGGLRPYTATFLIFSDYARNAIRMAALMGVPQILLYTHDSIGVGEDGPTHQPIEQLTGLRATPGLSVWRPCDSLETAIAWQAALVQQDGPTALVLSRQKLKPQEHTRESVSDISKGGYTLVKETTPLDIILIATGSEVTLAVQAAALLAAEGIGARVVSMPSADVFKRQDAAWQELVLPVKMRCRLAIEASHPDFWRQFVGLDGDVLGMSSFGASAPADDLWVTFGFTTENATTKARQLLARQNQPQREI